MKKPYIGYNHPNYRQAEDKAKAYFLRDYNYIAVDVVEKYFGDSCAIRENIARPEPETCVMEFISSEGISLIECRNEYREEHGDEPTPGQLLEFILWENSRELDDFADSKADAFPTWGTLFEARDGTENAWIESNVDLLNKCGIGVLYGKDNLNNMLFIDGGGYDFYQEHWIPMYIAKGWIKVENTKYPRLAA